MIVLLAGHGGKYTGAVWKNIIERDINRKIVHRIYINLFDKYVCDVGWINKNNQTLSMKEKTDILKKLSKNQVLDVYEIHCNSWIDDTMSGIEMFLSIFNKEDKEIYKKFLHNYEKQTGIKNRGLKTREYKNKDYYSIHRNSGKNSICKLLEVGFLSNQFDREYIINNTNTIADLITELIAEKNNLELKKKDIFYKVQVGAFRDKDKAEKLKHDLEKNGYSVYIKKEEG